MCTRAAFFVWANDMPLIPAASNAMSNAPAIIFVFIKQMLSDYYNVKALFKNMKRAFNNLPHNITCSGELGDDGVPDGGGLGGVPGDGGGFVRKMQLFQTDIP